MAVVYVTIQQGGMRGAFDDIPVSGKPFRSETITSSGTTAAGALVARRGDVATIFCATAVYANAGATASASAGKFCPAGIPTDIELDSGDVVHVIDA